MPQLPVADTCPPTPSAVVWISGRDATLVEMEADGHILTCEITRGGWSKPLYLAQVVRSIGDRQRLLILGPNSMRSALEREYVAMFRRRDRLVDVEPAGVVSRQELVDRLRMLSVGQPNEATAT
jgi:hypothetical protein